MFGVYSHTGSIEFLSQFTPSFILVTNHESSTRPEAKRDTADFMAVHEQKSSESKRESRDPKGEQQHRSKKKKKKKKKTPTVKTQAHTVLQSSSRSVWPFPFRGP